VRFVRIIPANLNRPFGVTKGRSKRNHPEKTDTRYNTWSTKATCPELPHLEIAGLKVSSLAKGHYGTEKNPAVNSEFEKRHLHPYSPPETNFMERLRYWAAATPNRVAYRYLDHGEHEVDATTYAGLDQSARAVAARLVSLGFAGKRAVLMYPPGLEFIRAFLGCHYAGVTPVPAYPPRRNRNMGRVNSISENCHAAVALTTRSVIERSRTWLSDAPTLDALHWVATEEVETEMANDWVAPKVGSSDVGLIQYTSGSTGTPKGVVLTHANLVSNCRMITRAFDVHNNTKACTWLPAYHDMGLIGGILNPLYLGATQVMMSPVAFLTYPIRWLRAMSDYGCTVTGGPNFAYAWCTTKIKPEQCEGLDLSSWEVAFNGAEPVRADVMDEFNKKFEPYGFNPKAHYPCYGMAETTLIVTGGDRKEAPVIRAFDRNELVQHKVVQIDESDRRARNLVGCGQVLQEEDVLIVHPETRRPLPEDEIGEIWINSPSCGLGYFERPEMTAEVFHARLSPDNGKQYVRSGDLGFMHHGELFVAGRLKDMIIVRGVNRYPQDIEATVESCHPATRSGGAAAFALTRWDREHLVIVVEVDRGKKSRDWDDVFKAIRTSIAEEHELPPDAIVLVRGHSIPKTSSGKVQRHACKNDFENKNLNVVGSWISWEQGYQESAVAKTETNGATSGTVADTGLSPVVVESVINVVKNVAGNRATDVDIDTNIVHLGLDSVERLDIAHTLEEAFGGRLPEDVLQDVETVRDVAGAIQEHIGVEPANGKPAGGRGSKSRIHGPIPESYFDLQKFPEFLQLREQQQTIESSGVRNPFFSVHEGRVDNMTRIDGRELISYASYNYLGLSGHPEVNAGAKAAIDTFGTSVSASRIVSGEKTIHRELEAELAEFMGVEDVMTFPGGHATNETIIGHLVGPQDLIVHDAFAHNSIVQGAILSGARRRPFKHNDWRDLFEILKSSRRDFRRVLIAVEGLYSMDGDYPDLPKFVEVAKRFKSWLYVDEAHSMGTLGDTGRGIGEMYGVNRDDVDCWMGTLSKSFGSCGGFLAGKAELIQYLRYTTPGYVFAAGMPPANAGAALSALRMVKKNPELVTKLQHNSQLFLRLAKEAGVDTGMALGTPIIPIICGHNSRALQLSEALYEQGINAQPILYPAVPQEETRVRIFMTASHTEEQIRHSVNLLADAWHQIMGGSNGMLVGGG
jgi:8-amino-7-oxononanoate synthase